jgi:hypothetical protein
MRAFSEALQPSSSSCMPSVSPLPLAFGLGAPARCVVSYVLVVRLRAVARAGAVDIYIQIHVHVAREDKASLPPRLRCRPLRLLCCDGRAWRPDPVRRLGCALGTGARATTARAATRLGQSSIGPRARSRQHLSSLPTRSRNFSATPSTTSTHSASLRGGVDASTSLANDGPGSFRGSGWRRCFTTPPGADYASASGTPTRRSAEEKTENRPTRRSSGRPFCVFQCHSNDTSFSKEANPADHTHRHPSSKGKIHFCIPGHKLENVVEGGATQKQNPHPWTLANGCAPEENLKASTRCSKTLRRLSL